MVKKMVGEQGYLWQKENSMGQEEEIAIRRFEEGDAKELSHLICRNFREVNAKDYDVREIEKLCAAHRIERIKEMAADSHMYVFIRQEKIVACGAIIGVSAPVQECFLKTIFVLPELHGRGIGRKILETLEQDVYFQKAERAELSASVTAHEFYRKCGYDYKDGKKELDANGLYPMEKRKLTG